MKILAVCGFGVGSSMVLKMTLDKVVNELNINAIVENTDISSAKSMEADVYFTSQELMPELKAAVKNPVYPIKKYMDKEEVMHQFKNFLENKGD